MLNNEFSQEFVDIKTGEYFTNEQLRECFLAEETLKKSKQRDAFRRKQQKHWTNLEVKEMLGGDFIQQQYINTVSVCLSDSGKFDSAFAFRMAYLTTYMDFNNILVFDASSKKITRFIEERDLIEVMGLASKQLRQFKKTCFDTGILEYEVIEGAKAIKVNKLIACKGKLPAYYKRNSIRVSVPYLQDIYSRAENREHKQLGYLIGLLPYINYEYSLLCLNPEQEYKNYLQPLTIQDICKILKYDITKASRLFDELRKTTLNGHCVFCVAGIGKKDAFFLNPKVFYKGVTPSGLKWLEELFESAEAWEDSRKLRIKNKKPIESLKQICKDAKILK
ncbi:hypothetical protein [Clostridium manihotivorum]|uniref:Uncharacterized protein n=1 Tax=Clostridium manihotivorum TaxID=2320868 RepID=A0A3R5X0D7_9CLOT|nr:hypothetical protein [Clostridium manihotivorum]QAA31175.1 hypothetical protein C1I91_05570 [Clostridium manihotivorum]